MNTDLATSKMVTLPPLAYLTPRQRRLLACLAEGKTVEEAAKETGISRQRAYQVIAKVQAPELMNENGLTDSALVEQYLKPALNAEETKFFQKDGEVTETRNVIAWGPRLQALELAARIKGMFAAPKSAVSVQTGDVSINIAMVGGQ